MTNYTLSRSKRKTIAIYIKSGALFVKAPMRTSVRDIERFIESKRDWIKRKLKQSERRINRYADIFSFDSFLYKGERIPAMPYEKKTLKVTPTAVMVPQKFCIGETICKNELFIAALKSAYKKVARSYLSARLSELSSFMSLNYASFDLTSAKGKWGSCDSLNRLRLNWHLLLLDESLIDYVIIHELAHTVHHNHSKEFWNFVEKFYPYRKEAILCLKDAGTLIEYLS